MRLTTRVYYATVALSMLVGTGTAAQNTRALTATRDLYVDATRADLTRVTSLLVGRNGDIIMRQMLDGVIRYFDSQGTPFTLGRRGDGPNEFRNIRENGFVGDTLWAADLGHGRVTFISPARTPLRTIDYPRTITTPGPNGPNNWPASFPVAIYGDGSVLLFPTAPSIVSAGGGAAAGGGGGTAAAASSGRAAGPPPASARGSGRAALPPWWLTDSLYRRPFVRATADGQFVKVVAWTLQTPDCGVTFRTSTGSGRALIPYCPALLEAVAADGDRVAQVTGTTATTTAGSYRVTVIGANADTIFSRTISYRPVAIPKAKNDSAIAEAIRAMQNRPDFTAAYRTLQLRTHYPPVRSILIGRDKTIWLEMWTPAAERSWQVLDALGIPIATVKFPPAVTVLAAELTAAWGIETDVDGLNSVVRYKLSG